MTAGFLFLSACDHTEADIQHSKDVCASIGITEESGNFPHCVQREYAARQRWRANMAAALAQAGSSFSAAQPQVTSCTDYGTTISCTHY